MARIRLLKFIDKYFGAIAVRIMSNPFQFDKVKPLRSIMIIRPGGIGDAALMLPLIIEFKKSYPEVSIDILAEKRNHCIFAEFPGIRTVYQYDSPKQLIAAIRNSYDAVIDTEQWHRLSVVIAKICNPQLLIGFDTNERRRLLSHAISYSHDDYEATSFINLLVPIGITAMPINGEKWLDIPARLLEKANGLLGSVKGKTFITLFPGASIREKRWEKDKFKALSERINLSGFDVVIIGASEDRLIGEYILADANGLNLAGKTSLLETATVIQKSCMLISGDSGVLHLAAALGVPTVSLFGPSNIKKWAPKGNNHIVISKNLVCSPCSKFGYTPKCPINAKCMSDIAVDEVEAAVKKLIDSGKCKRSRCALTHNKR